jgi:P-type Ca2+ transporter type 2C
LRDYISPLRPFESSGTSGSETAFTSSPLSAGNRSNTYIEVDYDALLNSDPRGLDIKDNPFAFTPKQLARLHDPKSLDVLRAMGGLFGLAMGLRTNIEDGLSPNEKRLVARVTLEQVNGAVREREPLRTGALDETEGQTRGKGKDYFSLQPMEPIPADTRPAALARKFSVRTPHHPVIPFEDRRRVFSSNSIPRRNRKNIFQLMWAALKDKILVRSSCTSL